MKLLFNWFISAIAILISAYLLVGVTVESFIVALVLAIVLGVINAFIKPVILLLTLPITIVTLGFFGLVINAGLILLASALVPGFEVAGFWWAFIFAILLTLVNEVFGRLGKED